MYIHDDLIEKLKKLNNTFVIINSTGEPQIVLLSYAAYNSLIEKPTSTENPSDNMSLKSLTSYELLDKLNEQIAQWKSNQNPLTLEDGYILPKQTLEKDTPVESAFYLESVDDEE